MKKSPENEKATWHLCLFLLVLGTINASKSVINVPAFTFRIQLY